MKGTLKFVCASAVALALALDGFGAWKGLGRRSRRDSGDAPRSSVAKSPASFAPAVDRSAVFAVAAGVDREKLWGLADSFLDRLIAASGTGGEPIRHLKAILSEYKKNPFKDLLTDEDDEVVAFLRESGVLDADFRWAVLSMDEMPEKDGEDSIPEGTSLAVAGDVDIEKFLRVTQRKLAEDEETASRFAEMTLEGERVWHLVPTSETSAREMKKAGIDFYVAWLDRQLAIVTMSRDVMARQLRLYRRGEGKIGAMRGDDVYDADAYFFVSGIGNAVREFASSKDLEDWKAIPNGEEVCRGLKTLEAKLKAGAGDSVSMSVRVSAASRHDADVLRTVAGLAFVGSRSNLVETYGDKGKALANILESVKVGGADDVIEISLITSISDLATALCPFVAEAMGDAETESAKGQEEPQAILVHGEPPEENLNLMACYYAEGGQKELSREKYLKVLEKDAANYDALMGLWKLSIMDGATDEARSYLKKAEKAKTRDSVVRLEVPLLYMMDNDLDKAHEALTQIGRLQPPVPAARVVWALDAGVMLMLADKAKDSSEKQRILAEVENGILPKLEQLSGSPRDFHVQMTRAFVLMRKGSDPETVKQARAALEVAWQSRPTVAVGGMVLDMDSRLQDRESAERHAKQILRLDENHTFANWMMGSIRMGEEKLVEAERYLRAAAGGKHPYAPALNDLAEILRLQGNLAEAEEFARAATKASPDLYVVWETLASTLLDRGKDLDEAESCIQKALEFPAGKADPRMQLTLVRVQIAKKNFAEARKTLRALDKRREELTSDHDRATLDELMEQAKGK